MDDGEELRECGVSLVRLEDMNLDSRNLDCGNMDSRNLDSRDSEDMEVDDDEEEVEPVQVKRGPGRPRKIVQQQQQGRVVGGAYSGKGASFFREEGDMSPKLI